MRRIASLLVALAVLGGASLVRVRPASARVFGTTPLIVESELVNSLVENIKTKDVTFGLGVHIYLESCDGRWRLEANPGEKCEFPGYDRTFWPMFEQIRLEFSVRTPDGSQLLDSAPALRLGEESTEKEKATLRSAAGSTRVYPDPRVTLDGPGFNSRWRRVRNSLVMDVSDLTPGEAVEGAFRVMSESRKDHRILFFINLSGATPQPNVLPFRFTVNGNATRAIWRWPGLDPVCPDDEVWCQTWRTAVTGILKDAFPMLRLIEGEGLLPHDVEATIQENMLDERDAREAAKARKAKVAATRRDREEGSDVECTIRVCNWTEEMRETMRFILINPDGSEQPPIYFRTVRLIRVEGKIVADLTIRLPRRRFTCTKEEKIDGEWVPCNATVPFRAEEGAVNEFDF